MYWLYLIVFTLIVFIPSIIQEGVFIFNEEKSEELAIFLLGSTVFFVFIIKEKQLTHRVIEGKNIQKKYNEISKDLNESYIYIGEINRKIDIIKNISLELAETLKFTPEKVKGIRNSIKEAISIFSKTNNFIIKYVEVESGKVLEITRGKNDQFVSQARRVKIDLEEKNKLTVKNKFAIVKSVKDIDGIRAYIIMETNSNKIPENIDLVQTLATQALFLYSAGKNEVLTS